MKTLMFYINSVCGGGAERVIIQIAYRFALEGYHSVLVTSFVDKNEYEVPNCVERISLENEEIVQSRVRRNLSRIRKLRKLCKQYKPEAILSFMAEPNFRTIIATAGLPVKRIVSVRNDPSREYSGRIGQFVGKFLLPLTDGCVFQTEDARQWFPKKLQKKSTVVFNAVDEKFFQTEYIGGKDIVTLGRLSVQKNQQMLMDAFAIIAVEFPDVNLKIYGIGNLESDLLEHIKQLRLENRISLMGQTTDVAAVLQNARLFVLSSNHEGMPNALMEALTVGVPSISTDCPCGGPKMLIKNGENGLLVPVGDKNALALAMRCILRDESYAKKIGNNARIEANQFQPQEVFQQWKKYIEKIIFS